MKTAIVVNIKSGNEGHIFHFTGSAIDPSKQYYARFKGNGGGFVGRFYKGSELQIVTVN